MLLRRVIGDALRARRQAQHRTLREVSTAANVSLGYLSEIERGQKEASSELLAAICEALGAALSEVLRDVSDTLALAEDMPRVGDGGSRAVEERVLVPVGGGEQAAEPATSATPATESTGVPSPSAPEAKLAARRAVHTPSAKVSIADSKISVAVRHDGPLRTTLRATRPSRERNVVYAA